MKSRMSQILAVAMVLAGCVTCEAGADPVIGNWSGNLPESVHPAMSLIFTRAEDGRPGAVVLYRWGSPEVCQDVKVEGNAFSLRHPGGRLLRGEWRDGRLHCEVATVNRKTGKAGAWTPFVATRNPPVPEARTQDAVFGEPIDLLAQGLDGWKKMGDNENAWTFRDGVLSNVVRKDEKGRRVGHFANIMTKRADFGDFRLEYDVRVPKDSNSGVYLRGRFEIQVLDSYGKPLDRHNMGAYYGRVAPSVAAERPAGEWQHVSVTLYRRHLTVVLNGVTIIDNAPVVGVTGGAIDADVCAPGPIYIQGDHSDADYRNLRLYPVRESPSGAKDGRFVDVSGDCPRYFAEASGKTFVPIGCNLCFDRLYGGPDGSRAECEARFFERMRKFAANGGNFLRLWLGHPFFEVMPERPGEYDAAATETVLKTVKLAEELGIRLKLTLESFRRTRPLAPGEKYNPLFVRPLYHPFAADMPAFFASARCSEIYLGKAQYLKRLGLGDSPAVICWELWNEINAMGPVAVYEDWSARMLSALKATFPRQMVVQNLGSFADPHDFYEYDYLARLKDNSFLQAHRYLDLGAALDVTRGPMDVLCADSVAELLARRSDRPALLAETGAVQARHAGPSVLYAQDRLGTLLHDEIFAPFFAGSAGCGQPWHWDHQYIDQHGLWHHFRRFAKAVEGLDPVAERFVPFHTETHRLRVYALRGRKTTVLWCRDKQATWQGELVEGKPAELISGERLPFDSASGFDVYLPWEDRSVRLPAGRCVLPEFRRSVVIRFTDGCSAYLGIQREI